MDNCPPEIHAVMFSYACTDDGTTGLSLSRVSRYIRQVSAPFQWQGLAISGMAQARGFVGALGAAAEAAHRPIYHLFLSTRAPSGDDAADGWPRVPLEEWRAWSALQDVILAHAAPTLETLTLASFDIVQYSARCLADVVRVPLPQLEELTLRGRCTPAQLACAAVAAAEGRAACGPGTRPRLRRLHLACAYHGFAYGTKTTHELVQLLAPGATHLRLSMLDKWGSRRVAEVLHAECAEAGIVRGALLPGTTAKAVAWPRVLPAGVRAFVIQPPPTAGTNFYCSCCMDLRGDSDVMRVFVAMAREADERFSYLPPRNKAGYGHAEAKADWLERIEGGGGCWEEKPFVEAEAGLCCAEAAAQQKAKHAGGAGRGGGSSKKKASKVLKRLRVWYRAKFCAVDDDGFGLPRHAIL